MACASRTQAIPESVISCLDMGPRRRWTGLWLPASDSRNTANSRRVHVTTRRKSKSFLWNIGGLNQG